MTTSVLKLADGAELSVTIEGSGRDLVLVTGLGGTAGFWNPAVPDLAQHFRVIRFDQRGIGKSTRGTAAVDIARLARDTLDVLEHAQSQGAVLLGHSTGGVILQELALQDTSRVAGLILSATWPGRNRYMDELFRARLAVLKVAPQQYAALGSFLGYPPEFLDANWATLENAVKGAPMSEAQQTVVTERILALLAFDRSSDVGNITLPTLIQGAEDDLIVPAYLQRQLAGLMPQATLKVLENGGHFYPVSRTATFVETLISWTKSNV